MPDPPVAVPGPASAHCTCPHATPNEASDEGFPCCAFGPCCCGSVPGPADPVVSPADTIRRALEALFDADTGVAEAQDAQRDALVALDALLAVGGRDRQQIALLTEVGKAAQIVAELNGEKRSTYGRPVTNVEWQNALYHLETAVSGARAVLAGEEDTTHG